MANHGKVGEKLQEYRDRKRKPREVRIPDPKNPKVFVKTTVQGRYEKPSYLKRKQKRAGN